MIKVSVLYGYAADYRFDMKYYLERHMPMVREKLGRAVKSVAVEAFQNAFGPHAEAILAEFRSTRLSSRSSRSAKCCYRIEAAGSMRRLCSLTALAAVAAVH